MLDLVRGLVLELRPARERAPQIHLDSDLDRDLGFDSLARAELLLRVGREFRVRLPDRLLAEVETPRELLAAVAGAEGVRRGERRAISILAAPPVQEVPVAARTLLEVLEWHRERHPDRLHVLLAEEEEGEPGSRLSYGELSSSARAVARGLATHGVEPGDRVGIMLPTSRDYFSAFFGALSAGAIPVPIYPPLRLSRIEDHLRRQASILGNAGARLLVSVPQAGPAAGLLRSQVEGLRAVESVESLAAGGEGASFGTAHAAETALLQYTSGSTGDPKGVVLSHSNLLANIRAMGSVMQVTSADVFVSWLPLYHDMGLIGAWLGSLYFAVPLVLQSPLSFLVRPESWLWAIHRHRGTLSAAPSFAFELCLHKIASEDLEGLDLGSLRMVANGTEPVSPATVRRFSARFGQLGFRPEAMAPVYGLAESSVGLTFPPPGRLPIIDRVERNALTRSGRALPARADESAVLELVSCGRPLPGHEIRVVDPAGRELPERHEGRVQFRGPSAASGYFRNPVKTRELFAGDWLETGDLGYISGGELFVSGRVKDLIVRAGRNLYPQEIEEVAGSVPGVRRGCVAVFGTPDPRSGTERIVVLAETRATEPGEHQAIRQRIVEATADLLDGPPDEVVLASFSGSPPRRSRSPGSSGFPTGRRCWWPITRATSMGSPCWRPCPVR